MTRPAHLDRLAEDVAIGRPLEVARGVERIRA
jgi:hypothetical protein